MVFVLIIHLRNDFSKFDRDDANGKLKLKEMRFIHINQSNQKSVFASLLHNESRDKKKIVLYGSW